MGRDANFQAREERRGTTTPPPLSYVYSSRPVRRVPERDQRAVPPRLSPRPRLTPANAARWTGAHHCSRLVNHRRRATLSSYPSAPIVNRIGNPAGEEILKSIPLIQAPTQRRLSRMNLNFTSSRSPLDPARFGQIGRKSKK